MPCRVAVTPDEIQKPIHNAFLLCFRQDSNRNHLRTPTKEDYPLKIQENPSGDSVFSDQKPKDDPVSVEIKNSDEIFTPFSSSLKRKRPTKLVIPAILQEVSPGKLSCRDRINEEFCFEFEGTQCGVFCKKGKKGVMEDTHKIVSELQGNSKKGFFGVYDGHGGRKAADFVAENLHLNIYGMLEKQGGDLGKEDAIKAGYLKTDEEFLKQGVSSGACCVTALIEDSNIIVSNVGDCRAVLCRGGIAEALTVDHRAGRQDERNRIEEQGGYVDIHHGAWRVQGVLAVSRSIGDLHLKPWVLAEPDTKMLPLTSDMEFLILASDGLWEKVGNQEAIDTAMSFHLNTQNQARKCESFKEEEEFGSENMSPPLKARRCGSFKEEEDFGSENMSPLLKARKCDSFKEEEEFWSENMSPPLKARKCDSFKEEEEFGSENTSPPLKARRISANNQKKLSHQENSHHKKKTNSRGRLMDACKELVGLASRRGSLDDITVMIIDLKHLSCN